jgi:hypothetical protein
LPEEVELWLRDRIEGLPSMCEALGLLSIQHQLESGKERKAVKKGPRMATLLVPELSPDLQAQLGQGLRWLRGCWLGPAVGGHQPSPTSQRSGLTLSSLKTSMLMCVTQSRPYTQLQTHVACPLPTLWAHVHSSLPLLLTAGWWICRHS